MKLTDEQLKQLIQEEMQQPIDEGLWDQIKAGFGGAKDVAGIVPQAVKSAGSAAMGALTGKEDVYVPARKGGTFARGKATRLMASHTKRMKGTLQDTAGKIEKMRQELLDDMGALKLDKYEEINKATATLLEELRKIYEEQIPGAIEAVDGWAANFSAWIPGAELTKTPTPDAPPEDPSKRSFVGLPPEPLVGSPGSTAAPEVAAAGGDTAETPDEEKERLAQWAAQAGQLKEHFKRYL